MPTHSLWTTALFGGVVCLLLLGTPVAGLAQVPDAAAARARADRLAATADSLKGARAIAPARQTFQQALALYRQVGADARSAAMLGDLGALQYLSGNSEDALQRFNAALTTARTAGATAEAANNLNNIGLIYTRKGRYDEALRHIREAVEVHRARGDSTQVAAGLNNLANIQEERGQYDAARKHLEQALVINRRQDDTSSVAGNLTNLGVLLQSQGLLTAALERHREALALHRSLDDRRGEASTLNNMGLVLRMDRQYDAAIRRYEQSIELNRALGRRGRVVSTLSNIGGIRREQGHYEEALAKHQEALRLHRERGERARVAIDLDNVGEDYAALGESVAALEAFREALAINRELGRRPAVAINLENIGSVYLDRQAYAAADSVFAEAVQVTGTLLQTASGADRRDFLAEEINRYQALVTTRVRAGRPEAALRVYERSRSRLLAERLARGDTSLAVPSVDSLQRALGPDETAVLYANTDTERPIVAIVVTRESVRTREIADDPILAQAGERYASAFNRLRRLDEIPWAARRTSLIREAKGIRAGYGTDNTLANLVRLYRHDVSVPPNRQLMPTARREQLGQFLYQLLLDPIEEEIATAEELIVVPDGALSYLPFEALRDWDDTRVIEQWRVRYVQSLRVLRLLQQRHTPERGSDRRSLLALGGAVYDPSTYAADTAGLGSGNTLVATARAARPDTSRQSESAQTTSRLRSTEPAATYREVGYGPRHWKNLTGTLTEVRALGQLGDPSTLLVGRRASERTIHRMSRAGALDDYNTLHFATHGFVMPEEPGLSALVLSEVGAWREGAGPAWDVSSGEGLVADGYLNMREIAALDLDAEFVGLSACRTGLGRIYRGSGAVSLAQAFLRAGAGSVAVSLWSIYDASTSRFMEAVYRRAWLNDTSWSEAMAETKRAFAAGDFGERLQAPRFWAPFVYYGWDAGAEGSSEEGVAR